MSGECLCFFIFNFKFMFIKKIHLPLKSPLSYFYNDSVITKDSPTQIISTFPEFPAFMAE